MSIGPNEIVSLLGQHSESEESQPISRIGVSRDQNIIATISYDSVIKFHNISHFLQKRTGMKIDAVEIETEDNMIEENESDMEDLEDSDDDDDDEKIMFEEIKKQEKKNKAFGKTNLKERQKEISKDSKKKFFSDL